MVSVLLLLFVGGIAFSQVVSDPRAVTLQWLRLGGLIAVTFVALAAVIHLMTHDQPVAADFLGYAAAGAAVIVQLMLTQLGKRHPQRLAAGAAYIVSVGAAYIIWGGLMRIAAGEAGEMPAGSSGLDGGTVIAVVTLLLSTALLGGFLMTMLLGHAYLTAGNEMTQAPFERLVRVLLALLIARLVLSGAAALYPWYTAPEPRRLWATMMLTARYLVGLAVPILFTAMAWECVRRRANQSATGILYVATVLVVIGEGIALNLQTTIGDAI